jgi:hypothetical protein
MPEVGFGYVSLKKFLGVGKLVFFERSACNEDRFECQIRASNLLLLVNFGCDTESDRAVLALVWIETPRQSAV